MNEFQWKTLQPFTAPLTSVIDSGNVSMLLMGEGEYLYILLRIVVCNVTTCAARSVYSIVE